MLMGTHHTHTIVRWKDLLQVSTPYKDSAGELCPHSMVMDV